MYEFIYQWNLDYYDDYYVFEGMFYYLDIIIDGCLKKDDFGMYYMVMDIDSEIYYFFYGNKEDLIILYNVFYSFFLREIYDKIFFCYLQNII